ncbi:double-stranded RNA-binding protein 1-like, partial [Trifolium medium]|nr:double-stranded RNA-binding protein 1-like [Trifolium medium]
MYKTQLQELCQLQGWMLPEYSTMREGPQHKSSYKAYVVVHGVTYNSFDNFNSSKEAQNHAA